MSFPTFSFARICGPTFQNLCLYVTGYLQIGTHLNHSLFSTRSARGFQTFHSELTVVWAKRNVVANKIESKSYYSPLILHSVRVLQKYAFEYAKNKRIVETVLLSTHETLHIKKYTLIFAIQCFIYSIRHMRMLRCTRVRAVDVLLNCCNF